ncbi:unnamed protein product [Phytophthora fragariaefolia]|uniref:Unnamed protein product n=1 Tax=Phytophthora fragariaefolia TaxID=1490495 RepID=A0A9W6Y8S1_9STRA|nr:unnamed protein product [Phytophthora fragariaefolia]
MTPENRLIELAMARGLQQPSSTFPLDDIAKDDPEIIELIAKANAGDLASKYHVINAHSWFAKASVISIEHDLRNQKITWNILNVHCALRHLRHKIITIINNQLTNALNEYDGITLRYDPLAI